MCKQRFQRCVRWHAPVACIAFALVVGGVTSWAVERAAVPVPGQSLGVAKRRDVSFAYEVEHAMDRGLAHLRKTQDAAGWWSTEEHPAVTALVLSSFMGHPSGRYRTNMPPELRKAYVYLESCAKEDGRIFTTSLANYNTAISVMALAASGDGRYRSLIERARAYLLRCQIDLGEKGVTDSPFDGGVGYNDKYDHSDMNNTLVALEAIYYTRPVGAEKGTYADLDWEAAIHFLQSCQNLPGTNREPWVSELASDQGGFIYMPGESKADGVTNSVTGKVSLRSYGSISYAGLLSYAYADLTPEDVRVAAVMDWLGANYTLEENPGMGQQGYYYYLHLMAKALATLGEDRLELKDGGRVDWRREVAMRLINLQKSDGSWVNGTGRWWENDPALVTAYAVMTLEFLYPGI
jgi:squalene-hopene/tetraprenyl-beta-curcumene cyclase